MIRTVALLALVASVSAWPFGSSEPKLWNKGFYQKFSANPLTWGSSSFVKLPQSLAEATKAGWVKVEGLAKSTGYADLATYVKPKEPTTAIYIDEDNNGKISGMMINIPKDKVTPYYDMKDQGFTEQTITINGATETYYTSSIYFVSEAEPLLDKTLTFTKRDKATRTYADNALLQTDKLMFESLYGKLDSIYSNLTDIINDKDSVWKEQNCIILMGLHYYYDMTESTTCEKPFVPYFGLYDRKTKQLIGLGMMLLGKCTADTFEAPDTSAVKLIVNSGPECLYDLVEKYGACTRHIYFNDNPKIITC